MESLGFTAIPAITVICYLVAQVVKATALDNKWLPIICGVAGAVLGIAYENYCHDHRQYKNNRAGCAIENIKRVYMERLQKHDFL